MKNERMVTRKLFISCILILCIIFATIIVLQREYYENKLKENKNVVNDTETQLRIIENEDINTGKY